MLTPEQIAALRDAAVQIADPISEYLLADIARRISGAGQLTSTAAYEIWRAQQLGLSQREIKRELKKILKKSNAEIEVLLTQSAEVGYRYDLSRLPQAQAIPFERNPVVQQIVAAAVKLVQEDFTNLTQTLGMVDSFGRALPLQKAYRGCMDYAFKQVATGAADYNTAIRQATQKLAEQGLRVIDYESGVHTSLEAAARRNIIGGLGLMQEQISRQNFEDMGCDGWEVSAHANSAPDHEPIQGKQYSDAAYKVLNNSLVRRIGTLNCGHSAAPIILGVSEPQYTDEELAQFREDNEKGVIYQGRRYSGYEATQAQRRLERKIRTQKRKILVDEATDDREKLQTDQIRLRLLNDEYRRFSKTVGLRTQRERAQVVGFGRGQVARAAGATKAGANTEIERLISLDRSRRARLLSHPELALPNANTTVVDPDKFIKYLFNKDNPRGYAKGIAFADRLGYNIDNWEELSNEIRARAVLYPSRPLGDAGHGMKYEQLMVLFGKKNTPANTVVGWIIENEKPRMTSAYVKEVEEHEN